jgi:hypothetical protein
MFLLSLAPQQQKDNSPRANAAPRSADDGYEAAASAGLHSISLSDSGARPVGQVRAGYAYFTRNFAAPRQPGTGLMTDQLHAGDMTTASDERQL